MSQYRFSGTVKRIEWQEGSVSSIEFIPDMEYSSSFKKGKDETITYAVFQPVDEKGEGFVFQYSEVVVFSPVKNVPLLPFGVHVAVTLRTDNQKQADFSLKEPVRHFKLVSIEMP